MTAPEQSDPHPPPPPDPERRRSKGAARFAWLAAGWVCFGVGAIGVVVPGLPTTGPMLLAVACFARGSERLHRWLLHHRVFGPSLRRWQRHRIIPLRAKVTAIAMMVASMVYLVVFSPLPTWAMIAAVALVVVGMIVVLRLPHRIRPGSLDALQPNAHEAPAAEREPAEREPTRADDR